MSRILRNLYLRTKKERGQKEADFVVLDWAGAFIGRKILNVYHDLDGDDTEFQGIKKCPFCDGDAFTVETHLRCEPQAKVVFHVVRCQKCGSQTGEQVAREQAIKAWNRRV